MAAESPAGSGAQKPSKKPFIDDILETTKFLICQEEMIDLALDSPKELHFS
jgi:hypothetical protein